MERNKIIDISKGISIILMTLSHLYFITKHDIIKTINYEYLVIFKMPLFIIISGFLYKPNFNIKNYLLKKTDGLIKPTISAIILIILIGFIYYYQDNSINITLLKNVLSFSTSFTLPLWFIFSLFLSLNLMNLLFFLKSKSYSLYFITLFSVIIVLSILNYYNIKIHIINLSTIIYFMMYLIIGQVISKYNMLPKIVGSYNFLIFLLLFSTLFLIKKFINIDMRLLSNHFEPFFLALAYSTIGVFLIFNLANIITKSTYISKILIDCGKSSFFILSFHSLIGNFIIKNIFYHFELKQNILFDIISLFLTIYLCIFIKKFVGYNKIIKFLFLPK